MFPDGYEALYEYLAKTPPQNVATPLNVGDVEVGARIRRADLHGDLPVRLSVARLDDSRMLCCRRERRWRDGLVRRPEALPVAATRLQTCSTFPMSKVRVIFYQGAGAYGTQ